jgi:hypothetical protein
MEVVMLLSILRRLSKVVVVYLLFVNSVYAGVLDLRLQVDQIFDVQWSISGGNLNASGFNYIYSSVNYATQSTSAARWTAAQTADAGANGRYIAFFNSTTNPGTYGMAVYNSDGSVYKIINNTGSFRALASGAIFYNGNNMWGTLITTEAGYANGSSGSWAITKEYPTSADLAAYQAPAYSGGQSAPPPAPTPVYGPSGANAAQQSRIDAQIAKANAGHGNTIEANIMGDDNDIHITQAGSPSYINLMILGNTNSFDATQDMDPGGHAYNETTIIGNTNNVDLYQNGTGDKAAFITITGDANTADVIQKDSGNHYVNLEITGDNHNASIWQWGSGDKSANVVLDGTQPWNFDLQQSGPSQQNYTLPHSMSDGSSVSGTCNAIGGCNLTVNQQ